MYVYRQQFDKRDLWLWLALQAALFLPAMSIDWRFSIVTFLLLSVLPVLTLLKKTILHHDRVVFSTLIKKTIHFQDMQQIEFDPALSRLKLSMNDGRREYCFFSKPEMEEGLEDVRRFLRTLIAYAQAGNGSIAVVSQTIAFLDDSSAEYISLIRRDRQQRLTIMRILLFAFTLVGSISYEFFPHFGDFSQPVIMQLHYAESGWAVLAVVLLVVTSLAKVGVWGALILVGTRWMSLAKVACPYVLTARIAASVLLCLTVAFFASAESGSPAVLLMITKFISCVAVEILLVFASQRMNSFRPHEAVAQS